MRKQRGASVARPSEKRAVKPRAARSERSEDLVNANATSRARPYSYSLPRQYTCMSLTADDFRPREEDETDDESTPLGDALAELAVDVDVDAVAVVRNAREDV